MYTISLRLYQRTALILALVASFGCERPPPESWLALELGGSSESTPTFVALAIFYRQAASLEACTADLGEGRMSFRFRIQPDGRASDFEIVEEERRGTAQARCFEEKVMSFRWPPFSGEPHRIESYLEVPKDVRE